MKNFLIIIFSIAVLVGSFSQLISSQNCDCEPDLCCSQWGYCGTSDDYCGKGCQSGPCTAASDGGNNGVSVADVVTDAFLSGTSDQAASSCAGKGFYTASAFLEALNSYSEFGTVGSVDILKGRLLPSLLMWLMRLDVSFEQLHQGDLVFILKFLVTFLSLRSYLLNLCTVLHRMLSCALLSMSFLQR